MTSEIKRTELDNLTTVTQQSGSSHDHKAKGERPLTKIADLPIRAPVTGGEKIDAE